MSKPDPSRLKDERWLAAFHASEWDFHSLVELKAPSRRALAARLQRTQHALVASMLLKGHGKSEEAGLERVTLASEMLVELGGRALLLRLPVALLSDRVAMSAAVLGARERLDPALGLWIDPGQVFPAAADRPLHEGVEWVADPLWHPSAIWRRSKVHKLHGWHEARWIRYYGELQLQTAMERSRRAAFLLFGHSKREEEAEQIRSGWPAGLSTAPLKPQS